MTAAKKQEPEVSSTSRAVEFSEESLWGVYEGDSVGLGFGVWGDSMCEFRVWGFTGLGGLRA